MSWFKKLFGPDESGSPPPSLAGEHVLVADASVVIQKVVELTLQDQGCGLTVVGSTDEARTALATTRPTVMIVAAELLGAGQDLLQGTRSRPGPEEAVVIIVTKGLGQPVDEQVLRRIRPDAVLTKPFEPAELIDQIRALRQGRRMPST